MTKKLICKKPFEWFEVSSSTGNPVHLCCSGWMPKPIGFLELNEPKEIWNSKEANQIRKSVLDGSFSYCDKELCPHINEISGPVQYVDQEEYARYRDSLYEEESVFLPTVLNCSYDRSCNLACPSCRDAIFMARNTEQERLKKLFTGLLTKLGKNLYLMYVTGSGDPFGSKHFLWMLSSGILNQYPQIDIFLHTNAQLLTSRNWALLESLENNIKKIEVSVDAATKPTYEINRKPGKWEILVENMKFISQLRKKEAINLLQIDFVVMDNNWQEMQQFIDLGKEWEVDVVYFSTINNWGTYSASEFSAKAIHKESHPQYHEFVQMLCKLKIPDAVRVNFGYFRRLIEKNPQAEYLNTNANIINDVFPL